MRAQPVGQFLRPGGFGKGVARCAQDSDEYLGLADFTGLSVDDGRVLEALWQAFNERTGSLSGHYCIQARPRGQYFSNCAEAGLAAAARSPARQSAQFNERQHLRHSKTRGRDEPLVPAICIGIDCGGSGMILTYEIYVHSARLRNRLREAALGIIHVSEHCERPAPVPSNGIQGNLVLWKKRQ